MADQDTITSKGKESPLDAEPAIPSRRGKPKSAQTSGKGKTKITVETAPNGDEGEENYSSPGSEDDGTNAGDFQDDSPLDADAEAQVSMVEVDRVGVGNGPGWNASNNTYMGQPVELGRVGSFPRTQDIYDQVTARAGGGRYRFVSKGKPVVFKVLNGAPKPLSDPDQGDPYFGQGGYGQGGGYDDGDDFFDGPSTDIPVDATGSPVDAPSGGYGRPTQGVVLDGYVFIPAHNVFRYFKNGQPAIPPRGSRPPALPGSTNYDHDEPRSPLGGGASLSEWLSMQEERRREEEQRRREEENRRRDEEKERRAEEREERRREDEKRREEEARRRDEERERREDEQRRRDDERERRREEENRRREDEQKRRDEERDQRRRDEERAAEDRKEAARLAVEAAKAQADAVREAAKLQAEAQKEAARAQADSNKLLFDVLLKQQSGGSAETILKFATNIADTMVGAREGSDNPASQISQAIQEVVPSVVGGVRDTVLAYKGFPVGGQPGVQGQPMLGPTAPAPQLPGPASQAPAGAIPNAAEVAAGLQLVQFLVQAISLDLKPTAERFADGVMAYDLTKDYLQIEARTLLATPELVVSEYEKGCAALGNPPMFANTIPTIRQVALSDKGKIWFQQLKGSLMAKRQKRAAPAVQAPASPTGQAPPAATAPTTGQAPAQGPTTTAGPNDRMPTDIMPS